MTRTTFFAALVLLALTAPAAADVWGVGARVGGYGFRDVEDGETTWDDCRMEGVGLFAERRFGRHLFGEAGLDLYNAKGEAVERELMDRRSLHATVAAGVRMFPSSVVAPYVQVGVGVEHTQVMMMTHEDTRVLPSAFLGLGAEAKIGRHLRLGMNVRFHLMGHFDHVPTDFSDSGELKVEARPVAQGQFFARYDL
jgi:hypothetical protein